MDSNYVNGKKTTVELLREQCYELLQIIGHQDLFKKVKQVDPYYNTSTYFEFQNAKRGRAGELPTKRLLTALQLILGERNDVDSQKLIKKQSLQKPPQSLQEKYPAAHKAQQQAEKLRDQRASTKKKNK